MKVCPNCNEVITQQGAFCLHCGTKLNSETGNGNQQINSSNQANTVTMQLDKTILAKVLVIISCVILSLMFFTKWYDSFSPLDRAMRTIQLKFNSTEVTVKTGEEWVEGNSYYDGWGGYYDSPGYYNPTSKNKKIVDPLFAVYDVTLSVFFIVTVIMLMKVVYNISRKKNQTFLESNFYNKALTVTIFTCSFVLVGSIALNNIERKIGYIPPYGENEAFVTFKSSISLTVMFFITAAIAIASRIFISHIFEESIKSQKKSN